MEKQSNATRLASIETMLSERLRESQKFEQDMREGFREAKKERAEIALRVSQYVTLETLSGALDSHSKSCPARVISRGALDSAKEHWPVLTTILGLAVTLGACLKAALDMLAPFLKGG